MIHPNWDVIEGDTFQVGDDIYLRPSSAKVLEEFRMAAQSLIEVWSEGESVDYPEALQHHVDWFRELLK